MTHFWALKKKVCVLCLPAWSHPPWHSRLTHPCGLLPCTWLLKLSMAPQATLKFAVLLKHTVFSGCFPQADWSSMPIYIFLFTLGNFFLFYHSLNDKKSHCRTLSGTFSQLMWTWFHCYPLISTCGFECYTSLRAQEMTHKKALTFMNTLCFLHPSCDDHS